MTHNDSSMTSSWLIFRIIRAKFQVHQSQIRMDIMFDSVRTRNQPTNQWSSRRKWWFSKWWLNKWRRSSNRWWLSKWWLINKQHKQQSNDSRQMWPHRPTALDQLAMKLPRAIFRPRNSWCLHFRPRAVIQITWLSNMTPVDLFILIFDKLEKSKNFSHLPSRH